MAAFIGIGTTTEEALAAATKETLIQLIAAANHRVKILEWGVYFDGISSTEAPVEITLERQSDAGTGSSLTLVKLDDSIADTLLTTAQQDFSVDPTPGNVLEVKEVHPQGGFEKQYRVGEEPIIGGGDRLAITATAPAIVNVRAYIKFEE